MTENMSIVLLSSSVIAASVAAISSLLISFMGIKFKAKYDLHVKKLSDDYDNRKSVLEELHNLIRSMKVLDKASIRYYFLQDNEVMQTFDEKKIQVRDNIIWIDKRIDMYLWNIKEEVRVVIKDLLQRCSDVLKKINDNAAYCETEEFKNSLDNIIDFGNDILEKLATYNA